VETSADRASLRWSRPELENGAPISNFKVRFFPADDEGSVQELETGSGSCEYECRGLRPGTAYFFGVCAQNTAGWGLWAPLNAYGLTKSAPPARPERLRVVATTVDSVRLGWARPVSNGSAIVLYEIIYEDSAGRACACVKPVPARRAPLPPAPRLARPRPAPAAPAPAPAEEEEEEEEEVQQEVSGVAPGTCLSNIQARCPPHPHSNPPAPPRAAPGARPDPATRARGREGSGDATPPRAAHAPAPSAAGA
jgi:hypothetical protein